MRLLLDTNALLWWLMDDARLGARARDLIATVDELLVSDVSLWEIVVKVRIGKLRGDVAEIAGAAQAAGFQRLGLELPHLQKLVALPAHHRDPFDHLLVAQALVKEAALLTGDQALRRYPGEILVMHLKH